MPPRAAQPMTSPSDTPNDLLSERLLAMAMDHQMLARLRGGAHPPAWVQLTMLEGLLAGLRARFVGAVHSGRPSADHRCGGRPLGARSPPPLGRTTPVTNRASGPARKAMTSATSAGSAARPMGMRRRNSATSSGGMSAVAAVSVSDGATALTRTPRGANSTANERVRLMTAALAALYMVMP